MEVSGQLHAPDALSPKKEPTVSLDRKLPESQGRSGRGSEDKNSPPLPGI